MLNNRPFRACVALATILLGASGPVLSATDNKAGRFYEDALARYEKNDIPGAIVQLRNALQQDNQLLPVHLLLGKALYANGEVAAAEVEFTEALRLGVNRAEVVIPLARSLVAQGKQKALLEQQQFLPAGLPAGLQRQLLIIRAAASADLGDERSAIKSIEEARAIDPRAADSWLAEASVRLRSGELKEAQTAAEKALSLAPDSAEAWFQNASLQHARGDMTAARAGYNKAVQLDPGHVEARVARVGLHLDRGDFAEANRDIAELKKLAPREPRVAYFRSLISDREGNVDAARAALREVTTLLDPVPISFVRFRPQLLLLNGLAHYSLNEPEKAKPYLELMLRTHGPSSSAKLLGQIYLSSGDASKAINILEEYLRAYPSDPQAMMLLASSHLTQGRHAKATALMQDALKIQDTPESRAALGISLLKGGQGVDAAGQLEAALKKDPGQLQAGFVLVGLYLRSNRVAQALTVAESMVKRDPKSPPAYLQLGLSKAASGDVAGARTAFGQALQLDPNFVAAKFSLARLDIESNSLDAAAQRLEGVLRANERDVEALLLMAEVAERRSQAQEALRWLEKARDHEGAKSFTAALTLVDFHTRRRDFKAAVDVVKGVLAKAPEDFFVLLSYARVQLAAGDLVAARTALKNAARIAEFDAPKQLEVALLQSAAGNLPGAQYSTEKALASQPRMLPALALMTELELRQGDPNKAERRARSIVEAYPKRAIGYSLIADIAIARGQSSAAVDAYRKAHQVEPSSDSLLRLFNALARQDASGRSALPLAEHWLKSRPNDLEIRRAVADTQARSGNFSAARKSYEELLKNAPRDTAALNNLANVQLRLNDPASAARTAEQALALDAGNPRIIDTLGWALHLGGQTDRALVLLRDARLRDPGNSNIRYHLAAALAKSGRSSEAREELKGALGRGEDFESKGDALRLLGSLP